MNAMKTNSTAKALSSKISGSFLYNVTLKKRYPKCFELCKTKGENTGGANVRPQ